MDSYSDRASAAASCPAGHYVEFYGGRWLVVPLEPVVQPPFFVVVPGRVAVCVSH